MVITRPVVSVLVVCLAGCCGLFAKPTTGKAKLAAAKTRTTTKQAASKTALRGKVPLRRVAVPRKPAAPAVPGTDRLREVQQALIDRGYLKAEATGQWNAASIDALKKFELDQRVKVDGKIDSKMLIALGLGPKYDSNLSLPVPSAGGGFVSADHSTNDQQR